MTHMNFYELSNVLVLAANCVSSSAASDCWLYDGLLDFVEMVVVVGSVA